MYLPRVLRCNPDLAGEGALSWGYESTGRIVHDSEFKEYGQTYAEKDVLGVYLVSLLRY